MDELKFNIKGGFGKHNDLDKAYSRFVKNHLATCDDKERERWETYSSIIDEIIEINRLDCFEKIKYRVTGGENINKVILSIFEEDNEIRTELKKYLKILNYYDNIDFMQKYI